MPQVKPAILQSPGTAERITEAERRRELETRYGRGPAKPKAEPPKGYGRLGDLRKGIQRLKGE